MRSRIAAESIRRTGEGYSERSRGLPPALLRLAAHRVLETQVIHAFRLPVIESDEALQDDDGNLLYLDGYSDPDGPDVGEPGEGG